MDTGQLIRDIIKLDAAFSEDYEATIYTPFSGSIHIIRDKKEKVDRLRDDINKLKDKITKSEEAIKLLEGDSE